MIKIGLTGTIGSGKSLVASLFEVLGIPVYHADAEAKKILDHPGILQEITRLFGPDLVHEGRIDRKKLAAIVFNDKKALHDLNALIHPRVREDLVQWIDNQHGAPYVVQEAAILFESGFHSFFDKNILVSCPPEVAIPRVMKRDGVTEQEVRMRMDNQWPEEKKTPFADFIIINDGSVLVIPQVLKIHRFLIPYEGSEPS